ncbi:MAG TPA: hypothetical protein VFS18_02395 [Actinomycetota bacterium]|nr:hypothetical protein [Actinomycetota bacterium]
MTMFEDLPTRIVGTSHPGDFVVGAVPDVATALEVVGRLDAAGFDRHDIHVVDAETLRAEQDTTPQDPWQRVADQLFSLEHRAFEEIVAEVAEGHLVISVAARDNFHVQEAKRIFLTVEAHPVRHLCGWPVGDFLARSHSVPA